VLRNEGSGLEKATLKMVGGDQVQESPQLGQSKKKPVMDNVGTSEDFICNLLFSLSSFFLHMCSIDISFQALSGTNL